MRFAYIDSQGNEVPIPSVDALALRVELGAIGPDTQLYDAQADRWGPASTHEIFHTLSRGTAEEGFVAPPPPVVPTPDVPAPAEPEASTEPESEREAAAEPPAPDAPEEARPVFDLSDEFAFESTGTGTGDEEAGDGEEEEDISTAGAGPVVSGNDDLGLDLTLADTGAPPSSAGEAPAPEPPAERPADESAGGDEFDFGSFGALEMDSTPFGETEEEEEASKPETDLPVERSSLAGDDGGGAMDFSGPPDLGGGMELEQPMSEFTPESPPAWMEHDEDEGEESLRFDSGQAEPPEEEGRQAPPPSPPPPERPPRERPTPRNRPSPPRRVRRRSPVGIVVGIVVVGGLGAGGWYGWQWLQHRSAAEVAAEAEPVLPPVTIPEIPAELLPTMRDLGESALTVAINRMGDMAAATGLAAAPDPDWLAGIYMANASQYKDVHDYWAGIQDFVDSIRADDTRLFHDGYVKQLEAASITGDTARMLLQRADSGFLATRQDRWAAYALMDDLVNAALDLHEFLMENESQIDYDPAAGGVSRDPVLEAVPKTKALGTEMWSRVDRITAALDTLGTLDKVTTERLTAVLFDRIRRAGFQ